MIEVKITIQPGAESESFDLLLGDSRILAGGSQRKFDFIIEVDGIEALKMTDIGHVVLSGLGFIKLREFLDVLPLMSSLYDDALIYGTGAIIRDEHGVFRKLDQTKFTITEKEQ